MIRTIIPATAAVLFLLPGGVMAQGAASAQCPDGGARCTVSVQLRTDTGELFGTMGLQISRDGGDPVAFALTPLGTAVRPGVRMVTDQSGELLLGVDACYPDGCRATLELSPEQLAQLAGAEQLSLQFFPLESDKAISGEVSNPGFADALRAAGVALP